MLTGTIRPLPIAVPTQSGADTLYDISADGQRVIVAVDREGPGNALTLIHHCLAAVGK